MVSSCYTRKLNDGQYLLDKNRIKTNNDKVDKDDLSTVIKQRPNRKIFSVVKFHLMLHNTMDSARVAKREVRKIKRKNKKIARKNVRKEKRGNETIPLLTSKTFDSFGEKILYSIGEAPVIYDSSSSKRTADQLHLYLIRKGFFNNIVKDSVELIDKKFFGIKKKRAEVYYLVSVNEPYVIKNIELTSKDIALLRTIKSISNKTVLEETDVFDIDKLDDERERVTTYLLNNGYYKFNKNYIKFFVDSALGSGQVNIIMNVDLFKEKISGSDSISQLPHSQYSIDKIKINYVQNTKSENENNFTYKEVDFYVKGKNDVNSNLIYRALLLKPGNLYSKQKQQQTFRKLNSLGIFRTVNIITEMDTSTGSEGLSLTVNLESDIRQSTKAEANATTSGSNFGIEGTVEYNIKNVFRGAEIFHIGVSGALESQPLYINDNTDPNSNSPIEIESFSSFSSSFNTIEFGPEVSLTIPSLLFINTNKYENISNTRTVFSASLNYQRRLNKAKLDFERGIQELTYGYAWSVKNKYIHQLDPISFSAVEVNKSAEFDDRINSLNDKLLAASFQNHIISATRYRFIYSDPASSNNGRTSFYYDANVESAGNILNTFYKITDRPRDATSGAYKIVGIQFAQYIKTQHDLRMYNKINDKSSFAFRFVGGLGIPMENLSDALPFEKSFFAGGTDKTRAWKARSLGPGSFRDSSVVFDKIGEVLLEGNMEYRFDLLGFLDGALFVDAGNIWLANEDSLRPGSDFKVNRFTGEIAIGAGFGIRVDLEFFIFRLDVAYPLKNPSLVVGERWFFQPKDEYNTYLNKLEFPLNVPGLYTPQINFGIGYPF